MFVKTDLGIISVRYKDLYLLAKGEPLILSHFSAMYPIEVAGRTVVDIGAYVGDTVLYFLKRGARYVIAYEPLYYEYVRENAELNKVADLVDVRPYGLWFEDGQLCIGGEGTATGLYPGFVEINVRAIDRELSQIPDDSVVKMDCERCEWGLLITPCSIIKKISDYIIEIHGPAVPIVQKMENCGFKPTRIKAFGWALSIWHFS
ncbi:MAG: FkbM family methyltransferase [Infirmifilum sp.]